MEQPNQRPFLLLLPFNRAENDVIIAFSFISELVLEEKLNILHLYCFCRFISLTQANFIGL